jgi:MFS family permease
MSVSRAAGLDLPADRPIARLDAEERRVILASSLGTIFEWYDFILFGSLAGIIGKQFFTAGGGGSGLVFALLAFSAGFIVRPLGALVFGRLGDQIGRKYTFLATILIMGLSTVGCGVVPTYAAIGITAPIILISLRLLQGLAIGGEYGGAAIYVAEHAPPGRRGAFTSWIQTTGTAGLVLSLIVSLITRTLMGEPLFAAWGWRIPFVLSVIPLALSVWIRLSMEESPVFARMRAEGTTCKAPISETFGQWRNLRQVLLALFGLIAGFAVVWYTTQFYALLFLTQTLKVDGATANVLVMIALIAALPLFVIFGTLSDRIGRKWLILSGIFLFGVTVFPIFHGLTHYANPALEAAQLDAPVVVVADPADCHFQFNLTGTAQFRSSCDIATARLVAASVAYTTEAAPAGSVATVRIGQTVLPSFDATSLAPAEMAKQNAAFVQALTAAVRAAGYPAQADPARINRPMVVLLLFVLVFYLSMAYGPAAAMLVEMFPSRIRYTALSLPYHIGTGWFGGMVPAIAFAMVGAKGDIYFGLWFPVTVALATVVIGAIFIRPAHVAHIDA